MENRAHDGSFGHLGGDFYVLMMEALVTWEGIFMFCVFDLTISYKPHFLLFIKITAVLSICHKSCFSNLQDRSESFNITEAVRSLMDMGFPVSAIDVVVYAPVHCKPAYMCMSTIHGSVCTAWCF